MHEGVVGLAVADHAGRVDGLVLANVREPGFVVALGLVSKRSQACSVVEVPNQALTSTLHSQLLTLHICASGPARIVFSSNRTDSILQNCIRHQPMDIFCARQSRTFDSWSQDSP